jgi:hypothetical protein
VLSSGEVKQSDSHNEIADRDADTLDMTAETSPSRETTSPASAIVTRRREKKARKEPNLGGRKDTPSISGL